MKFTITELTKQIEGLEAEKSVKVRDFEKASNEIVQNQNDLTDEEFQEKNNQLEDYRVEIKDIEKKINEKTLSRDTEREKRKNAMLDTSNLSSMNKEEIRNEVANNKSFVESYVKAIKGDDTDYKKMLSTAGTDGTTADAFGGLVPTIVSDKIQETLRDYKNLFAYCNIVSIKGLLEIAVEIAVTGANVHEEGGNAPTEEQITLDQVFVKPVMIKKWITWTDELELMSAVDLLEYLGGEFTKQIIIKVEDGILNNAIDSNGKGLQGIIPTYTSNNNNGYVTAVDGAGELSYLSILSMVGSVKGENPAFFMNRQTFYSNVLALTDTTGSPIFKILNDNTGKPQPMILGIPVYFNDAFKSYDTSVATDYPIALISYEAYKINAPAGTSPSFVLDRLSQAEKDLNKLVGKLYVGGRPVQLDGIALLEKGTAPTGE